MVGNLFFPIAFPPSKRRNLTQTFFHRNAFFTANSKSKSKTKNQPFLSKCKFFLDSTFFFSFFENETRSLEFDKTTLKARVSLLIMAFG